jgi:signal recognition particle receptor subunit beta
VRPLSSALISSNPQSQLVYGHSSPTHASLQPSSAYAALSPQKTVRIIDVPGHPRIRNQFSDFLSDAKSIAFVVDANSISRNSVTVAEHLHQILHAITSLPPSHHTPTLLVLCNKSDLLKTSAASGSASTLAVNRVKTVLERELEKRRLAQSGGVGIEGLGEEGERSEMGGLECGADGNSPFRFDEWEGGEVMFMGTSAKLEAGSEKQSSLNEKGEADGLASLMEWLEEQM